MACAAIRLRVVGCGVVIVGSGPEEGEVGRHIVAVIERCAHGNAAHVVAEDGAEARDGAWQHEGLQAHAHLELRVRNGPVNKGMAHFHNLAVRAKGAARGSLAPLRAAELELHRAREVLAGPCVQLYAEALQGAKGVGAVHAPGRHVGGLGQNLPGTRDLEVHGLRFLSTGCCRKEACQGETGKALPLCAAAATCARPFVRVPALCPCLHIRMHD